MNDAEWIEQAVFTSAVTGRAAGYQIVAASPGIGERDLRELAAWGPSHDALLTSTPGAASINFHPLPSGAFCVSRTTPAGWEYSGRGGARVYTQSLVVPPAVLARFSNNPFALVRAALAGGSIRVHDDPPSRLTPFRLSGRALAVDRGLLGRLLVHPGPDWMGALVQAALGSRTLALIGGPPAEHIIAGVINCLPPECRTAFSFSTSLKFSSRRPFRIVALAHDAEEQRRAERLYDVTTLRITGDVPAAWMPVDAWPRLIQRAMQCRRTSLLASELSKSHLDVDLAGLSALGLELLEALEASLLDGPSPDEADPAPCVSATESAPPSPPTATASQARPAIERTQAHAAHARFEKTTLPTSSPTAVQAPSGSLKASCPAAQQRLSQLDDLVRESIYGDAESLRQLRSLWPLMRDELGDALQARSREAYLRYALAIWEEGMPPDRLRNPERAVQTLDVLCLLSDER
ncbi:MAG: hypothetical protein GXY83_25745 [Rhodopirellula sp.]|nr:hypothetical protein [Rhodopirellula sp.]